MMLVKAQRSDFILVSAASSRACSPLSKEIPLHTLVIWEKSQGSMGSTSMCRGEERHYYVNMEVFRNSDQPLLEKPTGTAVATSTITEQHDGSCMWIDVLEHTIPVILEVVARELGCVVTYSEAHVSSILLNIVDAIENDFAACKGGKVML